MSASPYTVDYFIAKFEAIPEELWCVGTFEAPGGGPACAHANGTERSGQPSTESKSPAKEISCHEATRQGFPMTSVPTLKELCEAATKGPWSLPHFADPRCECDCRYVLCDSLAGCICTIEVDNGKAVGKGGNDGPPLEQAKANAALIARIASPEVASCIGAVLEQARLQLNLQPAQPLYPAFHAELHKQNQKVVETITTLLSLLDGKDGNTEEGKP